LNGPEVDRTLVFTKTKRGANLLADKLVRYGIRATAIHGNKSQSARQRALDAFRRKQVNVLVATDVAARGIDIDGITHVVNFDLPVEPENYVHRIGRTGRAGAAGIALTFCSSHERRELRAIEQLIGMKVPPAENQPEPRPVAETASTSPKAQRPQQRPPRKTQRESQGSSPRRPPARLAMASEEESKPQPKKRNRRRGQQRRRSVKQST
ncbi:MAG: C-terminal helicase domain-containing protein, partial [Planctomycetaceae bacterium]|nr:C-terminal helicase domain-containing protein [Planctomycetaceae bacterium]